MERVVVSDQKISLFHYCYRYQKYFAEKISLVDHNRRLYIDPWLLQRIMHYLYAGGHFTLENETFTRILNRAKRNHYSIAWPGLRKRNIRIPIYDLDFVQDSDLLGSIMDFIHQGTQLWETSLHFQDVTRIWSNRDLVECLNQMWNVPVMELIKGNWDRIKFDLSVGILWIPWTCEWNHSVSDRAIFSFLITIPGLLEYLFTNFNSKLKHFIPDYSRMLSWVQGEQS